MKLFFSRIILFFFCIILVSNTAMANKGKRSFYQLTLYQYTSAAQENILSNYLQNALLPALHRAGFTNIGVFKSLANDTAAVKTMYVFMTIKNLEQLSVITDKLYSDVEYQARGSDYINAAYTTPPYTRKEIILLKAFPLAPKLELPNLKSPKHERVYELRSYESATEKIFSSKVKMFNEGGETVIFKNINANAVFYSEVVAGSHMPNLMYMTCYENKADRDAHWKNFGNDPAWKTLSALPEYQHNVAHIDIIFLQPMDYSDF